MGNPRSRDAKIAQVLEGAILLFAVVWSGFAICSEQDAASADQWPSATTVWSLLFITTMCAFGLHYTHRMPHAARLRAALTRPERDTGLMVGVVLPAFAVLTTLVRGDVVAKTNPGGPMSLFYAWVSGTIGLSKLVQYGILKSPSFSVAVALDVLVLGVIFVGIGIENEGRYILACTGRVLVSCCLEGLLRMLPNSFTIGEALVVSQGLGLGVVDLLLVTSQRVLQRLSMPYLMDHVLMSSWGVKALERELFIVALLVGVFGSLAVCCALSPILSVYGAASPAMIAPPLPLRASVAFVMIVGLVILGLVYPWSCLVLDTWNPFDWLLTFLSERPIRFFMIAFWVICLVVLVPAFAFVTTHFKLRNIVARKLFHLLVVIMFAPAYYMDAPLLSLSYGVALSVFALVECVRAVSLPPFGQPIARFLKSFIDHREAGRVILTHVYLLLGCAIPLWLCPVIEGQVQTWALAANAGVIALGVGDAMGAAIGSTYGRRMLFGKKSVEGTLAIISSVMVVSAAFESFHVHLLTGAYARILAFIVGVVLTAFLECVTSQIDNLILPLFFFAMCNIVACH